MTDRPAWLPEMLDISEASEEVIHLLYEIFDRDLIQGAPHFDTRPIVFSLRKSVYGYEVMFWHLVTGDYHTPRVEGLDLDRANRLPWCAPTIDNALDGTALVWDYEEHTGKIRTYIWLKDYDYVVTLQKENVEGQGDAARLITAYCVNKDWGKRSLEKKHKRRMEKR
jgi:hypothetical protein